jgi:hypothetical protein
MNSPSSTRIGIAALAAAALLVGAAAVALANVVVYNNGFSKRPDVRQLSKADGGKQCKRGLVRRKKGSRMRVVATKGPVTCAFRPPVEGDGELPNHIFRVDGRISKGIPKGTRASAHIFARVRAGGGTGYELRVHPRGGRFELRRNPESRAFPVEGRNEAINGFGKRNRVRLSAIGGDVRASVNGEHLATVTDGNPGAVSGARLHFGIGHERSTSRNLSAAFTRLRVAVPAP